MKDLCEIEFVGIAEGEGNFAHRHFRTLYKQLGGAGHFCVALIGVGGTAVERQECRPQLLFRNREARGEVGGGEKRVGAASEKCGTAFCGKILLHSGGFCGILLLVERKYNICKMKCKDI